RTEARATRAAWKLAAGQSNHYPVPDEHLPLLDYYGSVYGPGPLILFHQLEVLYSRDAVLGALRMLLGHPRAASVADVQHALEMTGHTVDPANDALVYEAAPAGTMVSEPPPSLDFDPFRAPPAR